MRQNKQVNEWNDPHQIIETDETEELSEEQQTAILEAITAEYGEQYTTTPLDRNASFKLEQLTPRGDTPITEYEFEVQRFIRGTPGDRYSGTVHLADDGWTATYKKQQRGSTLLSSVRKLLPTTSTE